MRCFSIVVFVLFLPMCAAVHKNTNSYNGQLNINQFNYHMEKSEKPEEHIWFFIEFILFYNYNIETNSIEILSGEYIYVN